MNELSGIITSVHSDEELSIIEVDVAGHIIHAIVIETPNTLPGLAEGEEVQAFFKETEVVIGVNHPKVSMQNQLPCRLASIEKGSLLARLELAFGDTHIVSLISAASIDELSLNVGDEVVAMISITDVMLSV